MPRKAVIALLIEGARANVLRSSAGAGEPSVMSRFLAPMLAKGRRERASRRTVDLSPSFLAARSRALPVGLDSEAVPIK